MVLNMLNPPAKAMMLMGAGVLSFGGTLTITWNGRLGNADSGGDSQMT